MRHPTQGAEPAGITRHVHRLLGPMLQSTKFEQISSPHEVPNRFENRPERDWLARTNIVDASCPWSQHRHDASGHIRDVEVVPYLGSICQRDGYACSELTRHPRDESPFIFTRPMNVEDARPGKFGVSFACQNSGEVPSRVLGGCVECSGIDRIASLRELPRSPARLSAIEAASRLPFGRGKTSPVAAADVAGVVAAVLAAPEPHLGRIYELTGPRSQDMDGKQVVGRASLRRVVNAPRRAPTTPSPR